VSNIDKERVILWNAIKAVGDTMSWTSTDTIVLCRQKEGWTITCFGEDNPIAKKVRKVII